MDEIRTPWRMRYIASTARMDACIFCPPFTGPSTGDVPAQGAGPSKRDAPSPEAAPPKGRVPSPRAASPMGEGAGCDRLVLHHGTTAFVILNLYPYTTGHLMIVPYRHLPRFHDLTGEERAELARLLRQSERILRAATGARRFHAGVNLGRAAGAGVEGHLHVHLVPRDAREEWADAPDAEEPALPVEEAFRRLAPHFTAGGNSAL
jgi:diadenosine tetraphosphate (Ap4A) HIT family hydrolase